MQKSGIMMSGMLLSTLFFVGCAYKAEGYEPKYDEAGPYKAQRKASVPTYAQNETVEELTSSKAPCKKSRALIQTSSCESKKVENSVPKNTPVLKPHKILRVRATGQGVAPCNGACSPAQAYALAKRAAIADAYRLLAEKVKGVYVEGNDYVKNMAIKNSVVRTYVNAMIKNANITETTFKDGLCEVDMEIKLSYADLAQ